MARTLNTAQSPPGGSGQATLDTAPLTVAALLAESPVLRGADARREAETLLCAALNKPRSYLFAWPEASVPAAVALRYRSWLQRRARGVPVAYLLGRREFWSLPLRVSEATLIPRSETELLVERALAAGPPESRVRVADLGTGSGAIALALASERRRWRIVGIDSSRAAIAVAERNRVLLGLSNVELRRGDWFAPLDDEVFDVIVSNPPYLAGDDPHLKQGDLPFEPRGALVSGQQGLAALRYIGAQAPARLAPGGQLLLEHGFAQGAAVRAVLKARGFTQVVSYRDLAGHERVSRGLWPGEARLAGNADRATEHGHSRGREH